MERDYRADIDGLRGVAILAVLVFHAFPGQMPGGFLGVDVFFVVSGYLISRLIIDDARRGEFRLSSFYARRVRRIFPALIVVLTGAYAFGWIALFPGEFQQLGLHAAGGAGFASNVVMLNEVGYFDPAVETKPLAHLWSLAVEEQFYVVWPLLLWLVVVRGVNASLATIAIAAASLSAAVVMQQSSASAAFYLIHARMWELMAGAILVGRPAVPDRYANIAASIALLMLAGVFRFWQGELALTGRLIAVTAAAILIASKVAWLNQHVLSNRAVVWVGLISYPLYLWHWPLLSFGWIVQSGRPPVIDRLLALAVAVLLAWVTYRLVERPIRFGVLRRRAVPALACVMVIVAAVGYTTYAQAGVTSRSTGDGYSWNADVADQLTWKYGVNDDCLRRYPFDGSTLAWWFCMISKDAEPTVLILGNSFANHLYPGLARHPALAPHTFLSIGTCDPADAGVGEGDPAENPCAGDAHAAQQAYIDRLIASTPSIRHVILAGIEEHLENNEIERLERRLPALTRSGAAVIVFEPQVRPGVDSRVCFDRPFRRARACRIPADEAGIVRENFRPLVDALTARHPGVTVFTQNDVLCTASGCPMVVDGLPIYRDADGHLSEAGSRMVADGFVGWARTHVPALVSED